MTDMDTLTVLNDRFIEAFRRGSFDLLAPILTPGFRYLDGATGQVWSPGRYITDLADNPQPTLGIDQVQIHVDGDTAVVSARSFTGPDRANRYLDTYMRCDAHWRCIHACVWPLLPR